MKPQVSIYRHINFDGNIYVKINNDREIKSVNVSLFKDGEMVTNVSSQNNFASFKDNYNSGLYKAVAEITLKDDTIIGVESKELALKNLDRYQKETTVRPTKSLKSSQHKIYENVSKHYLEVKLKKGGMDKLRNEPPSIIPKFYNILQHSTFEIIEDNHVTSDSEVEFYKVKNNIDNHELPIMADELESLDYVIYCSVTPETTGMEPPIMLTEEQTAENLAKTENFLQTEDGKTPNFTHLQTYLNPVNGMNIHAAWDKGITGSHATVRHLDFGVYKNHEDLKGNITVVHSRSESRNCNHGTASTGCIVSSKNEFGVTGIAHDCSSYF